MKAKTFQLDQKDRYILQKLMNDARTPITLIARKLKISGAAIHQRLKKIIGCKSHYRLPVLYLPTRPGLSEFSICRDSGES